MIKKSIYILCTAFALGCGACNDWLTVVPETTLMPDNLFQTDEGCFQTLTGAYVLMAENIYSPTGIMGGGGVAEELACTWTKENSLFARHEYNIDNSGFGGQLDRIFEQNYKVVATLNPLIEACDENRDKLSEEYYNMVKGEALAIRACLHLDLIRLFGPMPSKVNTATKYLPYVRENSIHNYEYYTFADYMNFLLADLNEAEELLAKSDPVLTYPMDGSTEYTGNWTDRKSHFNYYGVLGLQARARMWMGDTEEALRYAKLVRDAKNEDGTSKFTLACADNMGGKLFSVECMAGVDQSDFDYQQTRFMGSQNLISYYNTNYSTFVNDLFGGNTNDLRWTNQWSWTYNVARQYVRITSKYNELYPSSTADKNFPVIRLAEMYLIIMETGTLEEANAAYEEFCTARNLTYSPMTEETRSDTVLWEYLREFAAEGQNFFTYKRFAVERMLWQDEDSADCGEEQYVLPLPPSEQR